MPDTHQTTAQQLIEKAKRNLDSLIFEVDNILRANTTEENEERSIELTPEVATVLTALIGLMNSEQTKYFVDRYKACSFTNESGNMESFAIDSTMMLIREGGPQNDKYLNSISKLIEQSNKRPLPTLESELRRIHPSDNSLRIDLLQRIHLDKKLKALNREELTHLLKNYGTLRICIYNRAGDKTLNTSLSDYLFDTLDFTLPQEDQKEDVLSTNKDHNSNVISSGSNSSRSLSERELQNLTQVSEYTNYHNNRELSRSGATTQGTSNNRNLEGIAPLTESNSSTREMAQPNTRIVSLSSQAGIKLLGLLNSTSREECALEHRARFLEINYNPEFQEFDIGYIYLNNERSDDSMNIDYHYLQAIPSEHESYVRELLANGANETTISRATALLGSEYIDLSQYPEYPREIPPKTVSNMPGIGGNVDFKIRRYYGGRSSGWYDEGRPLPRNRNKRKILDRDSRPKPEYRRG